MTFTAMFILLCCHLLPLCASVITTYKVNKNSYVAGSRLKTTPVSSERHCGIICMADATCGATNYNSTSGMCEILAVEPSPVTMVTKVGCSHMCCSCAGAISGTQSKFWFITAYFTQCTVIFWVCFFIANKSNHLNNLRCKRFLHKNDVLNREFPKSSK